MVELKTSIEVVEGMGKLLNVNTEEYMKNPIVLDEKHERVVGMCESIEVVDNEIKVNVKFMVDLYEELSQRNLFTIEYGYIPKIKEDGYEMDLLLMFMKRNFKTEVGKCKCGNLKEISMVAKD